MADKKVQPSTFEEIENQHQEDVSQDFEQSEQEGELDPNRKVVSITEAAKINKVTRQAIYVAIKQRKLRATKKTRWEIDVFDLEEYRSNKYSRKKSMFDGALLFDNEKGYYSINQVANMLGVAAQKIYYATRTGMIKGSRKGAAWVIHEDEVQRYKKGYLEAKRHKEQYLNKKVNAQVG